MALSALTLARVTSFWGRAPSPAFPGCQPGAGTRMVTTPHIMKAK